jgi:16S rRNA (uracil1498-N3)-methyltransferase
MHDFQFYVPPKQMNGNRAILSRSEFEHCCKVLRKKKGDTVKIFDGCGSKYKAIITEVYSNYAEAEIVESLPKEEKLHPRVLLGLGLLKNKSFELSVNFASSLEVEHLYPLITDNSVRKDFNKERFEKVSIEAVKQCDAAYLPKIHKQIDYNSWLNTIEPVDLKLIAEQDSSVSISKLMSEIGASDEIAVMIGPEGGFSAKEIKKAEDIGFIPVNVSNQRLRTEIAVAVLLANLHTLYQCQAEG